MRKRVQIHLPSDDMSIEISVPVLGLSHAPRVGSSLQPAVHHPRGAAVHNGSIFVQGEVIGVNRAVVDRGIRHVHHQARSIELRLGETFSS